MIRITPYKNNKGFTLVEVMVVVAIIGVLASVGTFYTLSQLPLYRLKKAADELYLNVRLAKSQAIKENTDWAIVFDVTNNRYCVCSDPGADGSWGDGVAGSADMTCTGDNDIEMLVELDSYGSGIKFGHGLPVNKEDATAAGTPFADDNPTTNITYAVNDDIATFNTRGGGKAGYVYLSNDDNFVSYAIGTGASGAVYLRQWLSVVPGAANDWD